MEGPSHPKSTASMNVEATSSFAYIYLFGLSAASQLSCNLCVPRSNTNETRPVNMSVNRLDMNTDRWQEMRPAAFGEVTCTSPPPLKFLTCGHEDLAWPDF